MAYIWREKKQSVTLIKIKIFWIFTYLEYYPKPLLSLQSFTGGLSAFLCYKFISSIDILSLWVTGMDFSFSL